MQPIRSISPHDHTFPALDGLRGLAVSLVLLVHLAFEVEQQLGNEPYVDGVVGALDPLIGMGGTGVHLFFVLSGFLLFLPFARHLLRGGAVPSMRRFYKRRALRILPAYYFVVTLTTLLFERDAVREAPVRQVLSHLLLVHNYSQLTFKGLNGPTWTMAVESQFYVMLPLFGLGAAWLLRRRRKRLLAACSLVLALASPTASVISVLLRKTVDGLDVSLLSAVSFLSVFAAGMAGALLFVAAQEGRLSPDQTRRIGRVGGASFVAVFGGVMVGQSAGNLPAAFNYYAFTLLMGLGYLGLLLHVLFDRDGRASRALARPTPRFLGDISFSLYLLHYPLTEHVSVPLGKHVPDELALLTSVAASMALLLVAALCSFLLVERPFLERKKPVEAPAVVDVASPTSRQTVSEPHARTPGPDLP